MAQNAFYVAHFLEGFPPGKMREALRPLLDVTARRLSSQTLTSAGLRIKGGSASAVVQAHTVVYASVNGTIVLKALDTDMAALAGTVTNAKFNVFCYFIDAGGTLTTSMGVEGATLAAIAWPPFLSGTTLIGFTIVNPTGTGNFVGGTTVLDDATVVPNAVFVNVQGAFDPNFQTTP